MFAKALPGVSFDAVYNGQSLTKEQTMYETFRRKSYYFNKQIWKEKYYT